MDLKLLPDPITGIPDLEFVDGEPLVDNGLETSVYLSLYTHRGWWGDREFGSDLHLLGREKFAPGIEKTAKGWAEVALQWLIDEGVAKSVTVTAERQAGGILALGIVVDRVDTGDVEKYNYNWEASKNGIQ